MLTFFVPFACVGESVNRMEGASFVFNGLPTSTLYTSLDIWDSSRDPMGVGSALPDPMNSSLVKKPWKSHWTAPSPTRDGWSQPAPCSHDLRLQPQVHTCTLTNKTHPTSWFQKGFRGLASVASWPRAYRRERERREGGIGPKILPQGQPTGNAKSFSPVVFESSPTPKRPLLLVR